MSAWQLIFLQSKVNNGTYNGEGLAAQNWDWPRETWFQKRLHHLRSMQRWTARTTVPKIFKDLREARCI